MNVRGQTAVAHAHKAATAKAEKNEEEQSRPSCANSFKLDPMSPRATLMQVEQQLEASGQDISLAKTFDLNKDGIVDEQEMEKIKASAHLSNPEQVIEQSKNLVQEHIERKSNYCTLCAFMAYFILYVLVLALLIRPRLWLPILLRVWC